jgi:FMN phosphatase YigB (HAD superfamily)
MIKPAAVLLDFGGVLADAPYRAERPDLVLHLYNLIESALSPGRIQQSLIDGAAAYARWRDEDWPDELPQREVWERFVIHDWPPLAQARVRGAVGRLSYYWAWREGWALRPGIRDFLTVCAGRGIPLAVVSNTLIYSDEAGVRKPNPQMIWNATDALNVAPASCWFVGDSKRRDIACARRADIGTAILMPSGRKDSGGTQPDADAVVTDGHELQDLLSGTP